MIYAINKRTKEHRAIPAMSELGLARDWAVVEADADGWIPWEGGECPLPDGAQCEYKMRHAGSAKTVRSADFLDWKHGHYSADIIAYRPILDAEPSKPEPPEWDGYVDADEEPPEWDGVGLPPAGCECEFVSSDTSWGVVKVIGMDDGNLVIRPSGSTYYAIDPAGRVEFRPIRTPAQRAEDALQVAILDSVNRDGIDFRHNEWVVARHVYAAIRDGKIPGVKLEG